MNTKPCSTCEHYDPILRGAKETRMGWCVKRSVYPHMDSPGQVTPAGATRVAEPEAPAKPFVVAGTDVRGECAFYLARRQRPTKADLMAKALGKKG